MRQTLVVSRLEMRIRMRAEELVKKQREYFESGVTLTYTFRLAAFGASARCT